MKNLVTLFILFLLVGCPSSTTPTPPTPVDPVNPSPPSGGECAQVLSGSIDLPTTLVDTPSVCDYLLEGELEVRSTLTIEPGVVVRATLSSSIDISGADFIAVGTPEKRIVFRGLEPAQGYWEGITVADARPSRIEYVDVEDAGQSTNFCQAGLQLRDVVTSLIHSTVSNSFVHGLCIDGGVEFTEFANNRFYGNAFAGVFIDEVGGSRAISSLDKASDYLGIEKPNGQPYIYLFRITLSSFATSQESWRKLNAPYYVNTPMKLSNVVLTLEPGTELIFEGGGRPFDAQLFSSGGLIAVGTADEPIVFRGARSEVAAWGGLEIRSITKSVFKHVEIRDAVNGIYLSTNSYTSVRLSETKIANTLDGIVCNTDTRSKLVELGPNVVFDVEDEAIEDDCTVETF